MSNKTMKVKLLFVDDGQYHTAEVELPAESVDAYDRLIDFVREDPVVLKQLHVDMDRLCAAHRMQD